MSEMEMMNIMFSAITVYIVGIVVSLALALVSQLLFGFAAKNDAASKGCDNPGLYGLIVAFTGMLGGIIYLCTRKNASRPWAVPADAAVLSGKAKSQLIWGIVCFVLFFVVLIFSVVYYVAAVVGMTAGM